MSVRDQIQQDMKEAMRAKDDVRLSAIRMLRAALQSEEGNKRARERSAALNRLVKERGVRAEDIDANELPAGEPLSDSEVLQVLNREIKQRQESIEAYRNGGRDDIAQREEAEVAVLRAYLPQQMSEAELRPLIQGIIGEVGATSKADLKKVMPVVMGRYRDRADGRLLNQLVQELLP